MAMPPPAPTLPNAPAALAKPCAELVGLTSSGCRVDFKPVATAPDAKGEQAEKALALLTDVERCYKDARCVRLPRHAGLCMIVEDPTARALKLAERLEKEAAKLAAEAEAWRLAELAGDEAPGCGRHPLCIRAPRHPGMCRLKGSKPGGVKKKPVKPAPPAGADAAAAALAASAKAGATAALKWRPTNVILEGTAVPPAEPAAAARVPDVAATTVVPLTLRMPSSRKSVESGALALARAEASLAITDGATLPAALAPPLSGKEAQSEASLALHGGVNPVLMTDPSPNLLLPASSTIEDLEVEGEAELAEMLGEPAVPEAKKRTAEEAELGVGFSFPALA